MQIALFFEHRAICYGRRRFWADFLGSADSFELKLDVAARLLSETAEFLYKTTDYYAPAHERCIVWNDPDLAIDWQLDGEPLLSAKDAAI